MKAEDKKLIYTLLKTADAYECGYTREKFAEEPMFEDDTDPAVSFSAAEVSIQPSANSTTV